MRQEYAAHSLIRVRSAFRGLDGLPHDHSVFGHRSSAGGNHSYFSILPEYGEFWCGSYLHKDIGACWAFLGWARPGSDWVARFGAAHSAESALAVIREIYREYIDWDLNEVMVTRTIAEDPHSWLEGAVHQVIRAGVGYTSGGHPVASLGDTSAAYDPIAGQGAQSGLIQAQRLVVAAAEHDGPFDATWITTQYELFLETRALAAAKVTRLFLSDTELTDIANQFFPAAAVHPGVADTVVSLLHHPQPLLDIHTVEDAHKAITDITGEAAPAVLSRFTPTDRFSRSTFSTLE